MIFLIYICMYIYRRYVWIKGRKEGRDIYTPQYSHPPPPAPWVVVLSLRPSVLLIREGGRYLRVIGNGVFGIFGIVLLLLRHRRACCCWWIFGAWWCLSSFLSFFLSFLPSFPFVFLSVFLVSYFSWSSIVVGEVKKYRMEGGIVVSDWLIYWCWFVLKNSCAEMGLWRDRNAEERRVWIGEGAESLGVIDYGYRIASGGWW